MKINLGTGSKLIALLLVACGASTEVRSAAPPHRDQPTAVAEPPIPLLAAHSSERVLSEDDPTMADGQHVQTFVIELVAGERVRVSMRSHEIDSLLQMDGPNGERLVSDDAFPGSLDAMIEMVPDEQERWTVRATTASPGETGAYSLSVERLPRVYGAPIDLASGAVGQLPASEQALGGAVFHFDGQAGALVRLRVTSTDVDTVAVLLGPGGERWENDDANDVGEDGDEQPTDSTLVVPLPSSGPYLLIVRSYHRGEVGGFRVASSVRSPAILAPDRPPPQIAGPNGEGRVLGVFAGITDYADDRGADLYGCADDARFLAEAFRARGLSTTAEQRVLTDSGATGSAFGEALGWLAASAGPDDVAIVFFSGHGRQQPAARPSRELDGTDETIALADVDLVDDDLVRALDAIEAGTLVLAVDACHSGGLADDFVTKRGRIGLFSSDEDILSDTAEPRRAGGYLSYHLRRAVLGDGDSRPRDGALFAGELTDHLHGGFVGDHERMNPPGSHAPMQRLVVRRGSVAWSELLWLYPRGPDLAFPEIPDLPLESAEP